MSNFVVSLIRTWVPIGVGSVIAWIISTGIVDVSAEDQARATGFATAAAIGGYYTLIRALERKYPKAGWLLGSAKPPEYVNPPARVMAED